MADDPASSIEEPVIGSSNERARFDAIAAGGERLPRWVARRAFGALRRGAGAACPEPDLRKLSQQFGRTALGVQTPAFGLRGATARPRAAGGVPGRFRS